MNKSKFLKKSLAAVLAVLMVVAMIPLSAAAADAPKVYVGSQQINFAGGASQSVTVSTANPTIAWDYPADGSAKLYTVNKADTETEVTGGTVDLSDFESPSENVYTVRLLLKEKLAEGGMSEGVAYTLTVTVKEDDIDLDATIKEVVNVADMVGFAVKDNKITITMPFGKAAPTLAAANFKGTNKNATIDDTNINSTPKTIKVTSASGNATMTYEVEVVDQPGFETFTVPTQLEDATIENKNGQPKTIAVKVDADTDLTKVIPTFKLGETVDYVVTTKGGSGVDQNDKIRVESGVTELDFSASKAFEVHLKNETRTVTVTVTLTRDSAGDKALLKSIQVGDKARTTNITGTDVTVAMGVNTNYSVKVKVYAEVSTGATVTIPSQTNTSSHVAEFTTTGNIAESNAADIDISGKKFTLRVTSGDTKTFTDYNITLVPASEVKTDLTDFTIKKGNNLYSAKFSGLTGTINLPYSMIGDDGTGWTVYATPSAGATAYFSTNPGDKIQNGTTTFDSFSPSQDPTNNGYIKWYEVRVAADDEALGDTDTTRTYTIKLVFAQPKTGSLVLSGTSAVGTNNVTEIDEDNTYKTEIGTAKLNGNTVKTIKITVPDSTPNKQAVYFNKLNLSEGAKAFVIPKFAEADATADTFTEVKGLDEKVLNAQTGIQKLSVLTANYGAVNSNGVLDASKAILFYVSSEKLGASSSTSTTAMNTAISNNEATLYYVYFVKADAETGKSIRSISSTVDKNVSAVLSGGKITITVPASYVDPNYNDSSAFSTRDTAFTLNFTLSKLASMKSGSLSLNTDAGKKDNSSATYFNVIKDASDNILFYAQNGAGPMTSLGSTASCTNWVVTSEAGGTANTTSYPVILKVAPAEKGATIKTLKVGNSTASISGTTINLNLPFGASLNPVKLDITADKMAKVFINGAEYKATNNYSLNSDVTITVTSEDTKTTNVYTLKTKVGDRFSDVKSTDWFDEYVQKAVDEGIVKGYDDGTFKPYNDITREEFALMTVRMLDVEAEAEAMKDNTLPFKDENKVSSWAKGAVAYCADKKIINGRDTGEFDPAGKITREEAAKILAVALGLDTSDTSASVFTDNARISTWARGYVNACQKRDIFGGDEAKRFNPQARITRAETAKVMVKSLEIK